MRSACGLDMKAASTIGEVSGQINNFPPMLGNCPEGHGFQCAVRRSGVQKILRLQNVDAPFAQGPQSTQPRQSNIFGLKSIPAVQFSFKPIEPEIPVVEKIPKVEGFSYHVRADHQSYRIRWPHKAEYLSASIERTWPEH